ncbi:glycosyltransferase [Candidatus Saccharibacteria bacterium]|nr:glycosyltransferase [Candidatus Saccharibacteria bacterium]
MKSFNLKRTILLALIFAIFLTSSFDVALTLELFGFTFRLTQLLSIVLMLIIGIQIIIKRRVEKPLGLRYLIFWIILLLLFTFNTILPKTNLAYDAWAVFNVALVFAFVNLPREKLLFHEVLRLYIFSFLVMALFGILEFILGAAGTNFPYITQWWSATLPRVNGLCFEPSYFSSYMLIGWALTRYLIHKKYPFARHPYLILVAIVLSLALSSSRMGLLVMTIFELIFGVVSVIRTKKPLLPLASFVITVALAFGLPYLNARIFTPSGGESAEESFSRIMDGTGIGGTSSHSSAERIDSLKDTLAVFLDSPILGRGFGGTFVEIAKKHDLDPAKISLQDEAGSMNITAEILAATGIFGFIALLFYLAALYSSPRRLSAAHKTASNSLAPLKGLLFALLITLIMFQLNQNPLRPYIWLLIAMVSYAYATLNATLPPKKHPKIAVDARMLKMSGIGTYLKNLVKNGCYDLTLGAPEPTGLKNIPYNANIYGIKEQLKFPYLKLWRENPALLHCPHYNIPLFYSGTLVTTVHDLTHLKYPEFLPNKFGYLYARFMLGRAVKKSTLVLTVSENTKKDILEYYHVNPDKIIVIPNGVSIDFKRLRKEGTFATTCDDVEHISDEPRNDAREEHVAKVSSLGSKRVLLYVGNLKPHKNLKNLLKAFAKLENRDDLTLRLVGKSFDNYNILDKLPKKLGIEKNLEILGEKSSDELVKIYNEADLFIFPSLYEGFGLPILESLRCGTPVVCSNTSSLPEVGADLVSYFDPTSPSDMARVISAHLDDKLTFDYQKAKKHCDAFSWKSSVEKTKSAFREAL